LAGAIDAEISQRRRDAAGWGGANADGDAVGTFAGDAFGDLDAAKIGGGGAEGVKDGAKNAAGLVGFGVLDDSIHGGAKDDEHDRGECEHEKGVDEGKFLANAQARQEAAGRGNSTCKRG
jgi:hypothetical protein